MPKYPDKIEHEIDRKRLARYWRLQSLLVLAIVGIVIFVLVALALAENIVENHASLSPAECVDLFTHRLAMGFFWLLGFLTVLYFLFGHSQARSRAMRTRLLVEGNYLRLIKGSRFFRRDRRIHFRAISDYSTLDGPLLESLGLRALTFRVIGLGQQSEVTIPAVIDAQKVRDELCAIDAMREGH